MNSSVRGAKSGKNQDKEAEGKKSTAGISFTAQTDTRPNGQLHQSVQLALTTLAAFTHCIKLQTRMPSDNEYETDLQPRN